MIRIFSFITMIIILSAQSCGQKNPQGPVINQPHGSGSESESGDAQATSGTLPAWQKGYLDIHFINSGRGECAFFILPDGTQMLVDCGASTMKYDSGENLGYPQVGIYPQPNDSHVAGWLYTKYIKKCMSWTGNNKIDYALNTHFDGDHLGVGYANYGITPPTSPNGSWYQTGFSYLMDELDFCTMIDRAYPDYEYPYAQSGTVKTNCDNYRKCADWHEKNGMKREVFKAGSNSQLALKYDSSAYPSFKIQNIFVNGEIWTGKGTATRQLFPDKSQFSGAGAAKDASPSENSCSAVFKLSYGAFDYYGGGDAGFNGASNFEWKDVEGNVAPLVGQVEVMKATHHGSHDGCSQTLLSTLAPSDIIVNVWQAVQPRNVTYERMISSQTNGGNSRIYTTNINGDYMADNYSDKGKRLSCTCGHIVVRVNPDGMSYCIYQLDSSDQDIKMNITKAFGPFKCK